jgi:3-dehydroquinate synthase
LIVALGGGVIGDLVGFAAATYLRGVSFVQIPTSLLAQVDSSVGGKVAVDLPEGKNLVGAFYQPKLVLIYPELLRSLPKRYLVDGMGEVIKYGCIKDATLFEKLESIPSYDALFEHLPELIFRCVEIKRLIVQQDTYDTGERMLLNFGHTLAHAIETKYAYQRESHGEAVAIGMYQLTRYAQEQGLTRQGSAERLAQLLQHYELPISCEIPLADLLPIMMRDKKNLNNHLHLVLLHQIGDAYLYPTSLDFFTHKERIL